MPPISPASRGAPMRRRRMYPWGLWYDTAWRRMDWIRAGRGHGWDHPWDRDEPNTYPPPVSDTPTPAPASPRVTHDGLLLFHCPGLAARGTGR